MMEYFIAYCFVSLLGSIMWIYYFMLIDVFEPEKLGPLTISFILGLASPFLLFPVYPLLKNLGLDAQEELQNALVESFLTAGLLEEVLKAFTFFCSFLIIRKTLHEPIDYLIHICLCALGFSATENVMYFVANGAEIIDYRFIFSSFGHIFDSSIFAYGVIYGIYKAKKNTLFYAVSFILLAAIFHGIFDFLLIYKFTGNILVFAIYFFFTVSIFSVTLNNALNNSSLFTYKRLIFPDPIFLRMMVFYAALLTIKTIILGFQVSFMYALKNLYGSVLISLPIVLIVFQRISRFTLIKDHWMDFSLELPFTSITYFSQTGVANKIVVKGHGQTETVVGSFLGTNNMLCSVSERNAWFDETPQVKISHKLFLENYNIFYRINLLDESLDETNYFIKAKIFGNTNINNQYPIVALLSSKEKDAKKQDLNNFDDFDFLCWCYLKPTKTLI
ncbi:MAG: PrsW family glutamic-type intramembrane protease [bacterium]|nr:PrsW family glutamic-type intramembrane protease [bacterium]